MMPGLSTDHVKPLQELGRAGIHLPKVASEVSDLHIIIAIGAIVAVLAIR
jgi:hypothetical protein